ncbi:multidrug efflux SMR transporter [Ponticaulis sp.]|uniref:DMT family transporter n=1 Tax=Ponticaulis sp. TaxID=2020902 RepID=UPI000B649F7D|nr:SMR family transporter [Ponticaulis sp.]MAI90719.1 QacE family quaternary ammonium compound efflux SMR transporter [Ponticaulis sp.]OUX98951.1 MAG: QacE family quaternary ammonium compound efflux SMR transporter [Hyphomonadaceae bacterium TMED5]|tara:strand:- start:5853 stop:6197 length:345 start_codon:yes stop_codon:yes gene_type:complete
MGFSTLSLGALGLAILFEVLGTAFLQRSEQFSRIIPSAITILSYIAAFYCLSVALRSIPLGIAYAIWAGLGIILVALVGLIFYKQTLDLPALIGIALIIAGVVTINVFSKSGGH